MKISIEYANDKDSQWLIKNDEHVDGKTIKKKISENEIIVVKEQNKNIGYLRFGFFWDEIPFMNMLTIEEEYRKQGIGKKLVQFWEKEMKKQNHNLVMTSTLSNEEAQHFYRKLGYSDAGSLLLPKEPLEILQIKKI